MTEASGSGRMRRVDEAIREVLSEAIPTLKDPRIGFVTVTGVRTTTDLKQSTVWLSVLGDERARDATLAALTGAAGVLQAALNRQLRLRRTPQLAFAYDPSVERGVRMTRLIDELAPADAAAQEPDADDD
jgi:ribosome-binding factor A